MPDQPNILFILTDQQRFDSMRCYGNDWIETPSLDALADRSFVFESAYVTQPVCTPSRSSIMTGLYPQTAGAVRNGIPLRPDTRTIAEMVSPGYVRAHYGKWHLGDDTTAQHGFEDWISIEGSHSLRERPPEAEVVEPDYNRFLRANGVEPPPHGVSYEAWAAGAGLSEELTQAAFLGNEATRFLREYPDSARSGRPFMLYVNFFEPHPPYTGPLNGLYEPASVEVGPAFLKRPEGGALVNRLRADYYLAGNLNPLGVDGGDLHDTTTEAGWRKLRAQYFANVTLVDRNVGRIMSALEESGMADETIVVFTSEHGEMAGDHGMLEKRSLYEEASRVPLLVCVPWLSTRQTRVGGVFGQIDLVPTLLDLAGEPVPDHLEGESRVPVLRGEAQLDENAAFLQWNGVGDRDLGTPEINRMVAEPWRGVVTGDRWKLNLSPGDRCELYDLNADPHEMRNLFDEPAHRDRVHSMSARVRAWLDRIGDTTPLSGV